MNLSARIALWYRRNFYSTYSDVTGVTWTMEILETLAHALAEKPSYPPTDFLRAEWDTCLIMDGLRHDTWVDVSGERTHYRFTKGACSPEYVARNYTHTEDLETDDIIYISANPHTSPPRFKELTGGKTADDVFYEHHELYRDGGTGPCLWDDEIGNVHHHDMAMYVFKMREKHPDKRIVAHFMVPHHPFLSHDLDPGHDIDDVYRSPNGNIKPWELAENGYIDHDELVESYEANVALAYSLANLLGDYLPGRILVTADHANLLGEAGRYGHPSGYHAEALLKVPFHIIDTERKEKEGD